MKATAIQKGKMWIKKLLNKNLEPGYYFMQPISKDFQNNYWSNPYIIGQLCNDGIVVVTGDETQYHISQFKVDPKRIVKTSTEIISK